MVESGVMGFYALSQDSITCIEVVTSKDVEGIAIVSEYHQLSANELPYARICQTGLEARP